MEQKPINIFNPMQEEYLSQASKDYLIGKKIVAVTHFFIEFEGGIEIMLDDETIIGINNEVEYSIKYENKNQLL